MRLAAHAKLPLGAVLAAVIVACAWPGAGWGAGTARTPFVVGAGDVVVIGKTAIQCTFTSKTVRCSHRAFKGDRAGTMAASLRPDWTVTVERIRLGAAPEPLFVSPGRQFSSSHGSSGTHAVDRAAARRLRLTAGDMFRAYNTLCKVIRLTSTIVLCSPWTGGIQGVAPGSKGFVVSGDGTATAFYADASGKLVQLFPLAEPEQVVQPQEVFTLLGSMLRCNAGITNGVASLACVDFRGGSPLGSPAFSFGDGSIIGGLIHPSTGQLQIEYRRPASRTRGAEVPPPRYTLRPGGRVRLAGSGLTCDGQRPHAAVTQIVCFSANAEGKPRPGSYGARFRSDGLLEAGTFDQFGALHVEFRREHA